MANRANQPMTNGRGTAFPPEADTDFDVVELDEITAWRLKLSERFGIGRGKLKSLDVVNART